MGDAHPTFLKPQLLVEQLPGVAGGHQGSGAEQVDVPADEVHQIGLFLVVGDERDHGSGDSTMVVRKIVRKNFVFPQKNKLGF